MNSFLRKDRGGIRSSGQGLGNGIGEASEEPEVVAALRQGMRDEGDGWDMGFPGEGIGDLGILAELREDDRDAVEQR